MAEDVHEVRLQGALAKLEARFDAMDRALSLTEQWPTDLEKRVVQLQELLDVKFAGVNATFAERDRLLTERTELLTRLFQKQHEGSAELFRQQYASSQQAIEKAESSMREQLVQVKELTDTYNEALSQRVASEKDRITALENRMKGAAQLWGFIIGGTMLVLVFLGFIATMS